MSHKKSLGGAATGDDPDELSRSPLQAVLLAHSFTLKFRPITLELPKVLHPAPKPYLPAPPPPIRSRAYPWDLNCAALHVLLPLVNVPMIDYYLKYFFSFF